MPNKKKPYKTLNVVQTKNIKELQDHQKIINLLETTVLKWAELHHLEAFELTTALKDKDSSKYFKYLRRILEIYLEENPGTEIDPFLKEAMRIDTRRSFDYISCGQMDMWEMCELKWYWRYPKGIKFEKTDALHFGSSIDDALNAYFEAKINNTNLGLDQLLEEFKKVFEKDIEKVRWEKFERSFLEELAPKVLQAYIDAFDDITVPVDVQTEALIPIKSAKFPGGKLKGYLDILEEHAIVDTKTAAKPWETTGRFAKHESEKQPRAYGLWYLLTHGELPDKFRYQVVVKSDPPTTQLIEFSLTERELHSFNKKMIEVWEDMNTKLRGPVKNFQAAANLEKVPALCSEKYCDYAQICRDKAGLRISIDYIKGADSPTGKGYHVYKDE